MYHILGRSWISNALWTQELESLTETCSGISPWPKSDSRHVELKSGQYCKASFKEHQTMEHSNITNSNRSCACPINCRRWRCWTWRASLAHAAIGNLLPNFPYTLCSEDAHYGHDRRIQVKVSIASIGSVACMMHRYELLPGLLQGKSPGRREAADKRKWTGRSSLSKQLLA
jgi:hypothetical protein